MKFAKAEPTTMIPGEMEPIDTQSPLPETIRVCLVEDHRATRETFAKLLGLAPGIECAGVCGDGIEALDRIPKLRPDVVLMDINLPGKNGIECVTELKRALPDTEFIMLTTYDDTDLIFDALRAGACGYLLKRSAPEELVRAIQDTMRGGSPMSMEIARRVVSHFHRPDGPTPGALTAREQEILGLLAKGLAYKEIADRLNLSPHTIHNRLRGIYRKLQVKSGPEAVAKFLRS
jgi:DNA-binding NarL/FixJ family response regulator